MMDDQYTCCSHNAKSISYKGNPILNNHIANYSFKRFEHMLSCNKGLDDFGSRKTSFLSVRNSSY